MTNLNSTERSGRRSVAVSVLVGIVLLTIPCYLLGFGLLWIARPAGKATDDGRRTTAVVPTVERRPTTMDAVEPTADRRPTAAPPPSATATLAPTLSPTPTVTPEPPPSPEAPTATPTEIVVVPLETVAPPPEPTPTAAP